MYLNSLNYFRAIAIIFIVVGHCCYYFDNHALLFNNNSIVIKTLLNFFLGGTTLFVVISGFLFHHVYYKKFYFKKYILKKIKFILIPYITLITIPYVYLTIKLFFFKNHQEVPYTESLNLFKANYLTLNHFFVGYWYIPFAMIIFFLSPVFINFIELTFKKQLIITAFFLCLSLIMHRGTYNSWFSIIQNVVYFIPAYLIGIICSENRRLLYLKLKNKSFHLLICAISISVLHSFVAKTGSYHKSPFEYNSIDLMIIQKIFLSLFFLIWLNKFEKKTINVLNLIAKYSFNIFFIHGIVIWIFQIIKDKLHLSFSTNHQIIILFLSIFIVFFSSLSLSWLIKIVLHKRSRYFIGV